MRANDKEIIDKLEMQNANLLKATSALVELISNFDNVNERKAKIKDLEHEGDRITHDLYMLLDRAFVTPLDREEYIKPYRRRRRNPRLHRRDSREVRSVQDKRTDFIHARAGQDFTVCIAGGASAHDTPQRVQEFR